MSRPPANPNNEISIPIAPEGEANNESYVFAFKAEDNSNLEHSDRKWMIAYIVFISIISLLSLIAMWLGSPDLLSNPFDPDHRMCGGQELAEYPYIFFVNPNPKYLNRTVCVKSCPKFETQPPLHAKLDCAPNSVVKSCEFKLSSHVPRSEQLFIYDSVLYLDKICMPANTMYFNLVRDALRIPKMDMVLHDIKKCALLLIFFGILTSIAGYASKYLIDKFERAEQTIIGLFVVSALGCFSLGILAFNVFFSIVFGNFEKSTKIIQDADSLASNAQGENSSPFLYLIISVVCFIQFITFVMNMIERQTKKKDNNLMISIINVVPEVIDARAELNYLPTAAFLVIFVLALLFIVIERHVYSIADVTTDKGALPFEQLERKPYSYFMNIIVIQAFFWTTCIVIQFCEYITLRSVFLTLLDNERVPNASKITTRELILETIELKMGTIIKGAFWISTTDWIRTPLESLDTNLYIFMKKQKKEKKLSALRNLQKEICDKYQKSYLKGFTKYGYIQHIRNGEDWQEAGVAIQANLIDSSESWSEDLLESGEVFENQLSLSICFTVSILYYFFESIFFSATSLSSFITSTFVMLILSFVIILFQSNFYGTVYASTMLAYLIKQKVDRPPAQPPRPDANSQQGSNQLQQSRTMREDPFRLQKEAFDEYLKSIKHETHQTT